MILRMYNSFFLIIIFCLSANVNSNAQETNSISQSKYQELQKELNLDKTKSTLVLKEKFLNKKTPRTPKYSSNNFSNTILQNLINILGYLAIFIAVITVLIFFFNKIKLKEKFDISPSDDDFIEDIDAVDVMSGLKLALSQRDYRMAIRMKFIELLQLLQAREYIDWKSDKTNRDYVYEITNKGFRKTFKSLANTYEFIWYGNTKVSEADFLRIDPQFNSFMMEVNE